MSTISTDVKSLSETVKERMGAKVAEFLPDEVFDRMLEAAVEDLVTVPAKNYANSDPKPALQVLIRKQIEAEMNERIKALLSAPEWQAKFDAVTQTHVSAGVEKYIKENAVKILTQALQGGIAAQISDALRNLRTNGPY